MARGEMVRFMAEREIENPEEIRKFDSLVLTGFSTLCALESGISDVKSEQDHITVLYDIVLAFHADQTFLTCSCQRSLL